MTYTFPHEHIFIRSKSSDQTNVLILFHGTGGNERDLIHLAENIAPDYNYFGVRGNVNEGGMPRFFRRLAEGVFDEADIIERASQLNSFLTEAAQEYGFDLSQSAALGYSNGANIISAINFLHAGTFSKSILLRPMTPLIPVVTPDLSGHKAMLSFGTHDPLMPPGEVDKLSGLYQNYGAKTKVQIQHAGHQLMQNDVIHASEFISE
ncbi:MAG TPA: carboxylesterase [Bacteroidetes bacterium]|nr:carboxylesterase [Bacteroidota bacterium]